MTIELKQLCTRAEYRSIDELAQDVRKLWDGREGGAKLAPRSLAGKIGLLTRSGGAQWWAKRPQALAALCEALDVAPAELGIGGVAEPDGRWVFRECPQLQPLDLRRERPCEIASWRHISDWFPWRRRSSGLGPMRGTAGPGNVKLMFYPVQHEPGQFWGRVSRGWGRVLLAASFAAAESSTHVEVDTLKQATEHPAARMPGRVIFAIRRPDPDTDFDSMNYLRHRSDGFVVFASHGPPSRRPGGGAFWPWDARVVHDGASPDLPDLWTGLLTPLKGWRTKLLHWAVRRSSEPFDPDALAQWLDKRDPECEAIRSPEDLLSVLSLVLERGRGRVTPKSFDANARESAKLAVARANVDLDDAWLGDEGVALLCELAAARARCLTVPLDGPLPAEAWAGLVPAKRLPGRLADGTPITREALAREAVRRLSTARLLRRRSNGLELEPDWFTRAVAQRAIDESVRSDDTQVWGELAAQPDRRGLIDASLTKLDASALERQLQRALEAAPSLGRAAALDSLVFAIAGVGAQISDELSQRVIIETLTRSVAEPKHWPPRPLTRAGLDNPHERLDALLAFWAWSRLFPRPDVTADFFLALRVDFPWSADQLRLCFPSWWPPEAAALSELLGRWFGTLPGNTSDHSRQSGYGDLSYGPRAERLMDEAKEFVGELTGPWPDTPAPWLVAARLLASETLEWFSVPELRSLSSHDGVVDWLSRALTDSGDRERSLAIMHVALSTDDGFQELPDRLSRVVQAQLSSEDVRALIDAHGYPWCTHWLKWSYVEPRLRPAIAATALAHPGKASLFWTWLFGSQGMLGRDDIDTLELLAHSRRPQLGIVGVELWRIRPTLAAELARAELEERCYVGLVCRAAPVDGLRGLLPTIRKILDHQPPVWLAPLLRVHVAEGGELGQVAFAAG